MPRGAASPKYWHFTADQVFPAGQPAAVRKCQSKIAELRMRRNLNIGVLLVPCHDRFLGSRHRAAWPVSRWRRFVQRLLCLPQILFQCRKAGFEKFADQSEISPCIVRSIRMELREFLFDVVYVE